MASKKTGLGKGLDALFPERPSQNRKRTQKSTVTEKSEIGENKEDYIISGVVKDSDNMPQSNDSGSFKVKISKIEPNREQPRKKFDEDALLELAESIKQYGVLQPLLVSDKKAYYEIIAGERRWRAAKIAGLKEIPVVVRELSKQETVEISLIENIQREDLNPVEEAQAYKRLIEEFQLKQDEVAERVSRSRAAIANSLRLLKLDSRVQQMMIDEMISAGHARAILSVPDFESQYNLAMKVFDEKLSVRETEKIVKHLTEPLKRRKKIADPAGEAIYASLEERMKNITGTHVSIRRKKNNKGKIEIEFYSREDLDRIIDLFESIG